MRDVFLEGFEAGRDVGAAVAVVLDGDLVVDLWAGHRDRRKTEPWLQDTLCCMFSVSKAVTALCTLQAVAEGLLQLDMPAAAYWPEFSAQGKGATTVRQLLAHQAGLIGFHEPVERGIYYDWPAVCAALAKEAPWWPPGERHGYHARTFGFLLGELIRRVSGLSVGGWLAERIAIPHNIDFHFGLTPAHIERCAQMLPAKVRPGSESTLSPAQRDMMKDFNNLATPTGAAFQNPSLGPGYMNSEQFRAAQMPAVNGHGTARAAAMLLAAAPMLLPAELLNEATRTHSLGPDAVLKSLSHFGLGLMLYHPESPIGVRPGSFGHAGAGGSMAFYDPEAKLGFCFVMNQMQEGVVTGGTSAMAVAEAVYACLEGSQ